MSNTIDINIVSRCGTGKTTIAQEIVDALRALKFNVEWDATPDHHNENGARKDGSKRVERLNATRRKEPKIVVKEFIKINNFTNQLNK